MIPYTNYYTLKPKSKESLQIIYQNALETHKWALVRSVVLDIYNKVHEHAEKGLTKYVHTSFPIGFQLNTDSWIRAVANDVKRLFPDCDVYGGTEDAHIIVVSW